MTDRTVDLLTHQTAGAVVRVHVGGAIYDLSISEVTPRTDAGGEPPSCVTDIVGSQFGLNWRPVTRAGDGSKTVHVSIATPDGAVLTVGLVGRGCAAFRDYPLELIPSGTQLGLGAGVTGAHPTTLRVAVNGASRLVRLWRTCTGDEYAASETPRCADDPLVFDSRSIYAVTLRA